MEQALPAFRFHPDPVQSGSIERSPAACRACGRARGWIYVAGCYAEAELDRALCPWCIADGTAHAKFDVTFHDLTLPEDADPEVVQEIEERTPGFANFNPFDWPSCCGAPMVYHEPAGIAEVRARYPQLEPVLTASIGSELGLAGAAARRFLESLQRDSDPCVHVFAFPRCRALRGPIDFA
jgi:uncharacterized protein CbrC (UPF0167 family)